MDDDALSLTLGYRISEIIKKICSLRTPTPHSEAVKAQCEFANEIFAGLLSLISNENGLAAEALLRTLFESCVNGAILARSPEKLPDFIDHAKLTSMKIRRSITAVPRPDPERDYEPEIKELEKRFKATGNWHLMKTTAAIVAAGFSPNLRHGYYIRASVIAHGEPYGVVRHDTPMNRCRVGADRDWWNGMVRGSYVQACLLMTSLAHTVNRLFLLKMDAEIDSIGSEVLNMMESDIKRMNSAFPNSTDSREEQ